MAGVRPAAANAEVAPVRTALPDRGQLHPRPGGEAERSADKGGFLRCGPFPFAVRRAGRCAPGIFRRNRSRTGGGIRRLQRRSGDRPSGLIRSYAGMSPTSSQIPSSITTEATDPGASRIISAKTGIDRFDLSRGQPPEKPFLHDVDPREEAAPDTGVPEEVSEIADFALRVEADVPERAVAPEGEGDLPARLPHGRPEAATAEGRRGCRRCRRGSSRHLRGDLRCSSAPRPCRGEPVRGGRGSATPASSRPGKALS